MYDLPHDLIDALQATPDTLAGLLTGTGIEQARSAHGRDATWSIAEVLCHLRDSEEIYLERFQAMRDQENPWIAGFDQEKLAFQHDYKNTDYRAALASFSIFRSKAISELSLLTPEQWQLTGQHSDLGQITILAHAVHHVSHDAIHCAQIARQLKKEA